MLVIKWTFLKLAYFSRCDIKAKHNKSEKKFPEKPNSAFLIRKWCQENTGKVCELSRSNMLPLGLACIKGPIWEGSGSDAWNSFKVRLPDNQRHNMAALHKQAFQTGVTQNTLQINSC